MISEEFSRRFPEFSVAIEDIKNEILQTRRPPEETIIDDYDLRKRLNISQRTSASWREGRLLAYSKVGNKIYYKLSDVLSMIEKHRVPSITENIKLGLYEKTTKKL